MRIETHHIRKLIEYCKSKNKKILIESDNYTFDEKIAQGKIYKDYLYCIKYFNYLISKNIKITKYQLYFHVKNKVYLHNLLRLINDLK
ncbi:hypothetical protein ALC152_01510 [Arcobacter sp. 15-2]|uniref:hypothetical protein n=1 Tax=Arcobacter sp. 15-2 TaxID=3374109 RepID=UPI00399C5534